jgi:hypothetical protein
MIWRQENRQIWVHFGPSLHPKSVLLSTPVMLSNLIDKCPSYWDEKTKDITAARAFYLAGVIACV